MDRLASATLEAEIDAALRAGRYDEAATAAIKGFGPEIRGFLAATERSEPDAADIFSQFCEDLWKGIPSFRGESSFRTWAYLLARNAGHRFHRDPLRRRGVPLSTVPAVAELEAQIRSDTRSFLQTAVRDGVAALRESLDPDDRMLLVLRVDRQMEWRDIAVIFEGEGTPSEGIGKRSAALRKRFERIKARLRTQAYEKGMVSTPPGSGDGRSSR
jgi:RNA polymerase sigma-70 factor (ECF subfamily)